MMLSTSEYSFKKKKGLLFFHQKCLNADSKRITKEIFALFKSFYAESLEDQEATRFPTDNDMNNPEIQLLEMAKVRAFKNSIPRSSLYWGTELYFLHLSSDHLYLRLPPWLQCLRVTQSECSRIDFDKGWTMIESPPHCSYFVSLALENKKLRLTTYNEQNIRISEHIQQKQLGLNPTLTLSSFEETT
jgi:hypothetical protein